MGNMAKMAQQMQAEMARVQDEIDADDRRGHGRWWRGHGGGQRPRRGRVDHDQQGRGRSDDVEMLQDLITAAVNDGMHQVKEVAAQKMNRRHRRPAHPGLIG